MKKIRPPLPRSPIKFEANFSARTKEINGYVSLVSGRAIFQADTKERSLPGRKSFWGVKYEAQRLENFLVDRYFHGLFSRMRKPHTEMPKM